MGEYAALSTLAALGAIAKTEGAAALFRGSRLNMVKVSTRISA